MNRELLHMFGLKFNPFLNDIPIDAIYESPQVKMFLSRVVSSLDDGGFSMLTGEPGTGKSTVLRLLKKKLEKYSDVSVGIIEHPQSKVTDFYRELGDKFLIELSMHNRWGGFKALRMKWENHVSSTTMRPVIVLDEAQEVLSSVFNEIRMLSSKDLDSKQLLCVIFSGDDRLPERFQHPDLKPLHSRIRRMLNLTKPSTEEQMECLQHLLSTSGNKNLIKNEVMHALVINSAGNYRSLMIMCDELLNAAFERKTDEIDERLFHDVYSQPSAKSNRKNKV